MRDHGHEPTVAAVRAVLAELRDRLQAGEPLDGELSPDAVAARAAEHLAATVPPKLRPVINATGIVLHTNLGRAPLAERRRRRRPRRRGRLSQPRTGPRHRQALLAAGCDPRMGLPADRGRVGDGRQQQRRRHGHRPAGVWPRPEVIVSRGQLIEIGGSFRIPEIMAVSGAILREVGTTNITRLARLRARDRSRTRPCSCASTEQLPHSRLHRSRCRWPNWSPWAASTAFR